MTVEYNDPGTGVTNTIAVEINDRGSFERGPDGRPLRPLRPDPQTIIDLTPGAFKQLTGNEDLGRVPVKVRVPDGCQ